VYLAQSYIFVLLPFLFLSFLCFPLSSSSTYIERKICFSFHFHSSQFSLSCSCCLFFHKINNLNYNNDLSPNLVCTQFLRYISEMMSVTTEAKQHHYLNNSFRHDFDNDIHYLLESYITTYYSTFVC
jgi:hypothetical protein